MRRPELRAKGIHLVLLLTLALSEAYSQGSLGPIPKRPRTLEDYQPSTLKDIVAIDSQVQRLPRKSRASAYSDLIPFRVSVIYTGLSRPISRKSKDALFRWTQCCAGNPDSFTKNYDTELRFRENRTSYWLAVQSRSLPEFEKELIKGQPVNLYLIRVANRQREGDQRSVLLVERFNRAAPSSKTPRQTGQYHLR